jgi:ArsR family transcriptional regulator, lead/cadmium/zinc/bismuth-responsive transcriptional repressor
MTEQEYSSGHVKADTSTERHVHRATLSIEDTQIPSCQERLVHLENVRQVQLEIMPMDEAQRRAELFTVLADPNRLRLLSALANQELCVCDLAAGLKMGESAVSHQLRVLKSMRMVNYRKQGRNVYYSLADSQAIELYRSISVPLWRDTPSLSDRTSSSTNRSSSSNPVG